MQRESRKFDLALVAKARRLDAFSGFRCFHTIAGGNLLDAFSGQNIQVHKCRPLSECSNRLGPTSAHETCTHGILLQSHQRGSADFDELTNECVRNGKRESSFVNFSFEGGFWTLAPTESGVRMDLLLRLPPDKVVHDSN
jgi:hypothetical protein